MAAKELYKSERLLYRAVENAEDDRAFFQNHILNDSTIQVMSTSRLQRPFHQKSTDDFIQLLQNALLGVMICLLPQNSPEDEPVQDAKQSTSTSNGPATSSASKPIPIGHLAVFYAEGVERSHHRNAMIGLSLAEEFRGKGYGGEAINWVLDWAFEHAGLHRIGLSAFSYNHNALKLYRKLGFVEEGREREAVFQNRAWHDVVLLSMLEHEWEELRGLKG